MTVLFVGFPFSIHTARWLSQLAGEGLAIHLFSSMNHCSLHPDIKGITYHDNFFDIPEPMPAGNQLKSLQFGGLSFLNTPVQKKILRKLFSFTGLKKSRALLLKQLIKSIQPDIIHSFETQHAGYLLMEARKGFGEGFPLWIHSNWGIDLHFFGKLHDHIARIKESLSGIDILVVEGRRDELLAREFGFKGAVKIFPSVGGGFHVPQLAGKKTSERRKILVKGTQDIVRRNLVALRALERMADALADFEIVLYSSDEITRAAAELFYFNTGKTITIAASLSHIEMLQLNAEARMNICVNMSDGLPNAMLEAMMMGAFPVQSNTSVADEWIENGVTGMLVPPEDPDIIEMAIRKALTDDDMVDLAAAVNRKKIEDDLEYEKIKRAVLKFYSDAVKPSPPTS